MRTRLNVIRKLLFVATTITGMISVPGHGKAAEMVKPKEMQQKTQWVKQHLLGSEPQLPFSFTYGGQSSKELLADWPKKTKARRVDDARTRHTVTWTDPKTGLELRCVAVEYSDFPTVEWTLYFRNNGKADTPILSQVQALDTRIGGGDDKFVLHHNAGTTVKATDFQPLTTELPPSDQLTLTPSQGRPCAAVWPYFNLQCGDGGRIIVVGWPGKWSATFDNKERGKGLRVTAGQELVHLKLQPGEEIRTPLMVQQFYQGDWLRAQNVWRRWMLAHNLPRPGGKLPQPILTPCSSHQFAEMTKADEACQIFFVDRYLEERIKIDFWWMDAGWYPCKGQWWNTGTWEVDKTRFPRGLRAISDHARKKGVKTIVWFEPERVQPDSWLYDNHKEDWLLDGTLLNLGNPQALEWVTNHIDKIIVDEGIDQYRQDYNIDPLPYWRNNDAPDRQGITENKYVAGYLAYWDELRRRHPSMLIDSCASGGHRNDLETMRRSVPMLRSDYIFEPVGQQGHTYGLAYWLPFFGTGPQPKAVDSYTYVFRSAMCAGMIPGWDMRDKTLDYDLLRKLTGQWRSIAPYFFGDYYPLTPYSLEDSAWISWQFNRPEEGDGMIQAFRRDKNEETSRAFPLCGLDPKAQYTVMNMDTDASTDVSGKDLMGKGLTVEITGKPGSAVITYKRSGGKKGNMKANAAAPPVGESNITWDPGSGQVVLANGNLELIVETKSGVNPRSLRDLRSGQIYADRDYAWPGGEFPKMEKPPVIANRKNGSRSAVFKGQLGSIRVEQTFTAPANEPGVILESITILNSSDSATTTAHFTCGFTKNVREGEVWSPDANDVRFCPVPYRRETNGQMQEFPLREVAERGSSFSAWMEPVVQTPTWGAEGWVWSKKAALFLIAKYNSRNMEWSLMEPLKRGATTVLRFGGAGQWKHEHPEGATRLDPGKSYAFGETRLQTINGDWKQAYHAYRSYMESKGCVIPKGYNPPVHWNELYDNKYFGEINKAAGDCFRPTGGGYTPEFYAVIQQYLDKYYTLDLMKGEAAKAKELGCEVLYMDPGWDVGKRGGLQVWDAERLGPMKTFVKMLKKDYSLNGVSLWCSLAGVPPTYCDAKSYPDAQVLSKDGKKEDFLICHPSKSFMDIKTKLLLELCKNGAVFLMFDSNQYSGPCYDKTHGHQIPSTREDHAESLFELARRVKEKYPHVLIEMHDPVTGPSSIHYTPTYFGYAPPTSFDCLWGHEFMWNPSDDLFSRRAVSLYYFNLAYSIPFYLHINLSGDNENALVFWWFASTIRHLGVGGKSSNPAVWEAQKNAMRVYMPLKRFYTRGVFYGIDEMTHAHTLPDIRESVLNIFNLEDKPEEKEVRFHPADVGLPDGSIQIEGASFSEQNGEIIMKVSLPAHGHRLVRVKVL